MKVAIICNIEYSDNLKSFSRTWKFVENGESSRVVEVPNLHNAIQQALICDILKGQFGTRPHIYKWLNRPNKIEKGNSVTKQNYKKL